MKTGFFYVYILRTEADPPHFYTGFTENLDARLVAAARVACAPGEDPRRG